MLNISKAMRERLDVDFSLELPEIAEEQVSSDGTRKWLLRLVADPSKRKPAEIECVYIPESDRGTLCVSSQVGCTLNCSFCHTGTQKLVRNLTAQEIVGQILVARRRLGDFPGLERPTDGLVPSGEGVRAVSNIVFMGMGEPLYNLENVTRRRRRDGRWRRAVGLETPHHRLDLRRRAANRAARRRMRADAGDLAARGARRSCATNLCR